MTAPAPDLKRNVPPPVAGSECCDCCEGIEAETPQGIVNPVGLSRIGYRVGDHAQFRASLHAALSSFDFGLAPGTPTPLARLLTRDDGDFTIGLIDAFACSADLLTFYQERIANESYLRTAAERVSVQEMGRLVGYRLKPGLAAETWLAFALETPPVPPANLPPEPGNFVTGVPASLRLDAGLKVQSVPGPNEKPQTFELVEALDEARPEWNAIRPWLSERHFPDQGDAEAWLAGTGTTLKPGDGVLFISAEFLNGLPAGNWDFRLIGSVEPDDANNRTRIGWGRGLGGAPSQFNPAGASHVYAMRRRSGVFGNNAVIWRSMVLPFRTDYVAKFGGTVAQGDWPSFQIAPSGINAVDLDGLYGTIAADKIVPAHLERERSFAILATGDFNRPDANFAAGTAVELYRVVTTSEVSRAEYAISAKVTRLGLLGNLGAFFQKVRETSVYAQSELLALARRPVEDDVAGNRIPVDLAGDGLERGRRLIVTGRRRDNGDQLRMQATLVAVHVDAAGRAELEIVPALGAPLRRESVVVDANVARASHGESVSQILGSGAAGHSFQRFELKQLPLSYRAASSGSGAAAELKVLVGDIVWQENPTLFGAAPTDRAYTLKVDEQGRTFVAFGDGLRGARLPSGTNNVVAKYRKGLGAEGNVAADKLTQLMTRPLGLKSASNPLAAEGGTDPERADAARNSIPMTTRTLGRAVSVLDYEDFALDFAGVAKAKAQVLNLSSGPTIAIALAAPGGATLSPGSAVWTSLLAALKAGGDPHVSVTLLSYLPSPFRIGIRVKCAEDRESTSVLAAVEAALRSYFSFDARALGQPVHQSEVIAVAQAVPGVVAVDLTKLYGGTEPPSQAADSLQLRLLATRIHVAGGVARPAELLTLDPGPLALLEEMP